MKNTWSIALLAILTFGFLNGATSTLLTGNTIDLFGSNPRGLDVTDPLVFSTLTGLRDYDEIVSVGLDNAGNIYAVGNIRQFVDLNYDLDCYLYKINGSDFTLVYERTFGGSEADTVTDMFVDPSGKVYITGNTHSPDFPIQNAYCNTFQNGTDCFIICFSTEGEIIFSTFLGGQEPDYGESIFVDDEGTIYVTGDTESWDFPLVNSYSNYSGWSDVFVAKLNSTGNGLHYSSLVGGAEGDVGKGITVDSQGNVYVAGVTISEDFPTINAYDETSGELSNIGPNECFVFRLNSTGNGLIFSTFFGGSGSEGFYDIELDSEGHIWVCGYTESNDFPTMNSFQNYSDDLDGIIFELSANGSVLLFSTIFGGQERDWCFSMDFDARDNLYITGTSGSDEFPLIRAQNSLFIKSWYQDSNCFVMKINPEKEISYSTFVGGGSGDTGRSIVVDEIGAVIVGGTTSSSDFPTRREISKKYEDQYIDGFVFNLLDISDEDGDNIPNWWETANGYDPFDSEVPMSEFFIWYAQTILVVGVAISMTIIILWFERHRIRSWTKRLASNPNASTQA
ncbi:MAG: SBBP repeat-containing protein [Promethearchaeota archaeon]